MVNPTFKNISIRRTVCAHLDEVRGPLSYSDIIYLMLEDYQVNHTKKKFERKPIPP